MKKILLSAAFLAGLFFSAAAQEQAIYSQYQLFPILVNPAHTGFSNKHEVLLNSRTMWSGFPGGAKSYTLQYNGPVSDKLGIGAGIFSENIGSLSRQRMQLNYAFRFKVKDVKLGVGLSTEFHRVGMPNSILINPLVNDGDPVVERQVDGEKIFDASAGFTASYNDGLFFGVALPNMIRQRLDQVGGIEDSKSSNFSYYVFQLGYTANLPEIGGKIIPNITMRKIVNVPYQVDLNVRGEFLEQKLIAGLTYRPSTGGSMAFLIGTRHKPVQIFYSYDVSFQGSQQYHNGSHEISLMFDFDRKQKKFNAAERLR